MDRRPFLAFCVALSATAASWAAEPRIVELRVDQPGPDRQEFFELSGDPGAPLDGYFYVVLGDGDPAAGCGVIEELVDLRGLRLDARGLLCVAEIGSGIEGAFEMSLNFEDNDNVTHLLVRGCEASLGADLDVDDDGRLDSRPWQSVVDGVALSEGVDPDCAGNERIYASAIVQPSGAFSAGHAMRCDDEWIAGAFEWPGLSTPGAPNDCLRLAAIRR